MILPKQDIRIGKDKLGDVNVLVLYWQCHGMKSNVCQSPPPCLKYEYIN